MIYSDFRPLLNRVKFIHQDKDKQVLIQFYNSQFTKKRLHDDNKDDNTWNNMLGSF